MESQGKIIAIMPTESGIGSTGNAWKKQLFVIETMEQKPSKIAFECWNDDTRFLETLAIGNIVKVLFNVESREYNSKWYTQLRSWKIQLIGK